jgi:hypothetical protein
VTAPDWPALQRQAQEASEAWSRAVNPWHAPQPGDLVPGHHVLAFDATLSATGWVHLRVKDSCQLLVLSHGTLRVKTEIKGYLGTYEKAARMRALMAGVIRRQRAEDMWDFRVFWEAPVVAGHRTESSLIAGCMLHQICDGNGTAIAPNHASKVLTGSPRHDKQEIRAAVARFIPEAIQPRTWTEHECDAAAVGLTRCLQPVAGPAGIK